MSAAPHPLSIPFTPEEWLALATAASHRAPDHLTIAYMAMGAADALQSGMRVPESVGGQLDLIDQVIGHAALIDTLADRYGDELAGVFSYEVAEPFGAFIAKRIAAGNDRVLRDVVRQKAQELIRECCGVELIKQPTLTAETAIRSHDQHL
jgi:hypothetical protein